jgi:hypothetical protein
MSKTLESRIERLEQRLGTRGPQWPTEIWIRFVGGAGEDDAAFRYGGKAFRRAGDDDTMIERGSGETLDAFCGRIKAASPHKRKGGVSVYWLDTKRPGA